MDDDDPARVRAGVDGGARRRRAHGRANGAREQRAGERVSDETSHLTSISLALITFTRATHIVTDNDLTVNRRRRGERGYRLGHAANMLLT